ncbi:MAG: Holliday junction branch migration protein RuvA [Candidatus Niyogibacteria bacterium]|nr:MAG: Holliday junction branch migration protein RuvA [Candidatus Niyogibacteria bacterium]
MIISLEGKITFKGLRYVILEAGGIGYKVFVAPETLQKLSQNEGKIKIFTSLYIREDAMELYGFMTLAEMELFETLNNVPGVGPRTALGVLGIAPVDTLKRAIAAGETSYLTKVSGIGRKTAEKIVIELREKMGKGVEGSDEFRHEEDALDALRSLGYSLREAREALNKVPPEVKGVSDRIKSALNILGRGK